MQLNQHMSAKVIGFAIIVLALPLSSAWAEWELEVSTVGIAPSVGVLWSQHGGLGIVGDMSGSFLLANASFQYAHMVDVSQRSGRVYGGLGVGMYIQVQIGVGHDGWNTRLKLGIPLKKNDPDKEDWLTHGDPLLSVFGEFGPARDVRTGAMLGVFLQTEDWR